MVVRISAGVALDDGGQETKTESRVSPRVRFIPAVNSNVERAPNLNNTATQTR
jgi:hypothetical protein